MSGLGDMGGSPRSTEDLYPSRCQRTPDVLERRDPVLHRAWTPDSPLSERQAAEFESRGYIVLPDVLRPHEVDLLQEEAEQLLARPMALERETLILERGSNDVRSIFKVHAQSSVFGRLASDARLVRVAQCLLDDDVYVHQSRLNYKPGFRGKEFYWHSDFETWHVEDGMPRMRALSMSILLTENTSNNGPLMLIPGSHKRFVACVGETPEDHYKQSLRRQDYGVPDDDSLAALVKAGGVVAPTGAPGQVVVFDCNMMHGSNGNITPSPRSNAFFVYNAVSNRLAAPYGPARPRPEFVASRATPKPIVPVGGDITRSS